jgi:hypothetical protein
MLVFSSGTAKSGNTGALMLGTGAATGGRGGLVSISVGSGDSLGGGSVYISGGYTSSTTYSGGDVMIAPGQSTNGDNGAVYIYEADGSTAIVTVSETEFTVDAGDVSLNATTTLGVYSGSTLTISGTSGVLFANSPLKGFEYGSATVTVAGSAMSVTVDKMTGKITSASTDLLGAGETDSITLTNSRITADSLVFVTVQEGCTGGYVIVVEAAAAAGSATLVTYNAGASACTSTYVLHYLVVNN